MTAVPINREKAVKYARAAQAGCVVLLVSAVAIAGLGLPGVAGPGPGAAELPPSQAENAKLVAIAPPVSEGVDFKGISERLGLIDNAPKPVAPPPTETAEVDPALAPTTTDQPVRFLGAIVEPTRRIALLSVGGRQRAVAPGQMIHLGIHPDAESLKVVSVDDNSVVIEDRQGRRTIDKAPKSGGAVTMVSEAAAPMTPDNGNVDPNIRAARDMMRGQDPETRRRFFQEMRNRGESRRNREGNE